MNINFRFIFLILGLGFYSLVLKSQDKIYLPYFEVLNMPAVDKNAATLLFSSYLKEYQGIEVQTAQDRDSLYISESSSDARESAEAWGVTNYMIGQINRIGNTALVSVKMYNTSDKSEVWSQSGKANSADDVHILLERFAMRASISGLKELPKGYNNKTEFETSKPETKKVITSFGLTTGSMFPVVDGGESELVGGLGMLFSFDAGNLIFDSKLEGFFGNPTSSYYGSIDVLYPFGKKSNAFYTLIGLGFGKFEGRAEVEDSRDLAYDYRALYWPHAYYQYGEGRGTIGFVGGGYIINRDKKTQLRLGVKGFYAAFDILEEQIHQPFGGIFTASILFH